MISLAESVLFFFTYPHRDSIHTLFIMFGPSFFTQRHSFDIVQKQKRMMHIKCERLNKEKDFVPLFYDFFLLLNSKSI